MTTTADKIEKLKLRIDECEEIYTETIAKLRADLKRLTHEMQQYNKPSNPKPLECWANVYEDMSGSTYRTEELAEEDYSDMHKWSAVKIRQVTPEMVQDELDAKRYRKLKDLHCATAPDWIYTPWQWDRQLDKAMEK